RAEWSFLAIEEQMKKVGNSDILRLLAFGHSRMLFLLKFSVRVVSVIAMVVVGLLALAFYVKLFGGRADDWLLVLLYVFFLYIFVAIVALLLSPLFFLTLGILKLIKRESSIPQILKALGIFLLGWLGVWIQLLLVDKWYLALGNIKDRPTAEAPPQPSGAIEGAIQIL